MAGRAAARSRSRARIAAGAVLAAVLLTAAPAAAKSYHFPRVEIDARLLPDGTLELREARTYAFDGEFSSAFFTVDRPRNPLARIEDFTVEEDGREIPVSVTPRLAGGIEARWEYSARDEERTFLISYRIPCAVEVYDDAAHLYWQFVGTGWTEPTDLLRVTLRLPGRAVDPPPRPNPPCPQERAGSGETVPLERGEVRAWGHGPLGGEVRIPDPQTVVLEVEDLSPETFVEGSILLPESAVPLAPRYPGGPGRERILAEEEAAAEEANAARRTFSRERAVAWGLIVGIPFALLLLVALSRMRDRVAGVPRVVEEPPEDLHPVELSYLWDAYEGRYLPRNAFRTQLLHLARRGAISLEAVGRVSDPEDLVVRLRKRPKTGIDADFVDFLFPDSAERISVANLKATGKRRKPLRTWTDAVEKKTKAGVDRVRRSGPRLESFLLLLVALGAGFWWVQSDYVRGLTLLAAIEGALAWVIGGRFLRPRLPVDLRERMGRWAAFRRFLKEFSSLPEAPALAVVIWERYLVYATALGVADAVEKQVRSLVAPEDLPAPWRGAPAGVAGLNLIHGFGVATPARAPALVSASPGSGISSSSFSSGVGSFSSGGGFGGGFSGGGGGGGGGTGGGAS